MMNLESTLKFLLLVFAVSLAASHGAGAEDDRDDGRRGELKPHVGNPFYWQYGGEPVLLLGGSCEDNLFQISNLEEHLDLLASVGGNYVRNTMSARDAGNVWPFRKVGEQYDLGQWNDAYWRRFEDLLKLTSERAIIVQIEVWATFDFYRKEWQRNPFNPKNNINYTAEQTGLPERVDSHPVACQNNFFWSVPAERRQENVLTFQQCFVDKMLSYSLRHGHVLYCMDNETSVTPEWGKYWSQYIKQQAERVGVAVNTTEMWDAHNLDHAMHRATFEHPETYSFVDISQNNHQKGQAHWDNGQRMRQRIAAHPRPLNNVKIYGGEMSFGSERDAIERFWRNVFGGMASARFHRPRYGMGLNEAAQVNIQSMRQLTDKMDVFTCEPHNELLSDRTPNEAYCLASPGKEYALFFPNGGEITLDTKELKRTASLRWLDIMTCRWSPPQVVDHQGRLTVRCPCPGYWAVLIQ